MVAEDFNKVLQGKYPAKSHAERVVQLIKKEVSDASGILYLEGRWTKMLEDSDLEEPFRQRRYFYYLTGCDMADCAYIYDIQTSKSILFIPGFDAEVTMWSGLPLSLEAAKSRYDVDEVRSTTDISTTLAHFSSQYPDATAFAIANQVSDDISFTGFKKTDFEKLKRAIEVSRVVKDEFEVALIRKANEVSGAAHLAVIAAVKSAKNEIELDAIFRGTCISQGAKKMAYEPIAAGGRNGGVLHYEKNDEPLDEKLNFLLDAGAEWNNYASDITRTFPINGKFTKESREIYDIVLAMQNHCLDMLKAGVKWDDVHLAAHKIAIDGLLALGILKGDKTEIFESRTTVAFLPAGLGHYIGLDTHDTGGNANYQDPDPIFRYLRIRGSLPAGCVVTVEPGLYFNRFVMEPVLRDPARSKYFDMKVLEKYWDVGGVRIEDNVLVTEIGYENLTNVPKEPAQLEAAVRHET